MARPPRELSPDDRRLWARITGTVTPPAKRKAARVMLDMAVPVDAPAGPRLPPSGAKMASRPPPFKAPTAVVRSVPVRGVPEPLEPRRQRRLSRERDPIEARIDLHGHGRFQAQDALTAFLRGAQARGYGAVLVITGQGRRGGGIIRASVHEWLLSPALRGVVSGFASAHRRHGGDGAIYVTIRRT